MKNYELKKQELQNYNVSQLQFWNYTFLYVYFNDYKHKRRFAKNEKKLLNKYCI